MEKRCKRCGKDKPLDEFHSNRHMRDGRLNTCAACYSEIRGGGLGAYRPRQRAPVPGRESPGDANGTGAGAETSRGRWRERWLGALAHGEGEPTEGVEIAPVDVYLYACDLLDQVDEHLTGPSWRPCVEALCGVVKLLLDRLQAVEGRTAV